MLHRDDIDYKIVEEIEKQLKKEHPNAKVLFPGDHENDLSDSAKEAIKNFNKHRAESFLNGLCFECGQKIPCKWPPEKEGRVELPKGWHALRSVGQEELSPLLICPECNS